MGPLRSIRPILPVLAAAALLSACAGGLGGQPAISPVKQVYWDYSFAGNEVGYAEQFNPIPVYLRGGPFANERDSRVIVDIMNQNRYIGNLVFTPVAAPNPRGYSMIFAYGPQIAG